MVFRDSCLKKGAVQFARLCFEQGIHSLDFQASSLGYRCIRLWASKKLTSAANQDFDHSDCRLSREINPLLNRV